MAERRFFTVERDGPVVVWKYENPPKNLLNMEARAELDELVGEFESDDALRAGVLTSALPDVFIQHFDVQVLADWSDALRASAGQPPAPQPAQPAPRPAQKVYSQVPKPMIAAINGWASGGGCELALTFDFRFISSTAVIGLPESQLGILPGGGGTQRLSRLIGAAKALEIMMLGKIVSAEEAYRVGIVHRVCEPNELLASAVAFGKALAGQPPLALAHIKRCVYEGIELPLDEGLALERRLFRELMVSDDANRLMRAYVEGGQDRSTLRG